MLAAVFTGCAKTDENAPNENNMSNDAVTVTDMMGREITLEEPVTRVVALTPSDCEILYAIGAGDAMVGRGNTVTFHQKF